MLFYVLAPLFATRLENTGALAGADDGRPKAGGVPIVGAAVLAVAGDRKKILGRDNEQAPLDGFLAHGVNHVASALLTALGAFSVAFLRCFLGLLLFAGLGIAGLGFAFLAVGFL